MQDCVYKAPDEEQEAEEAAGKDYYVMVVKWLVIDKKTNYWKILFQSLEDQTGLENFEMNLCNDIFSLYHDSIKLSNRGDLVGLSPTPVTPFKPSSGWLEMPITSTGREILPELTQRPSD